MPIVLMPIVPEANAQVISAQDSVQTHVVQQNSRFNILGGTTADSATLLFHSFERFDLEHNQTAEFHVEPGIEAVFSRIINGVPSHINGGIELSGSPASLYLINPAGVLFGTDAVVNLAGDFTVLTAERLDFNQGHFGIFGYPSGIQGNILQLHFDTARAGNIVNLGDLRVGANQSLSLIGHSVINQGTLRGGSINIAAVGAYETVILDDGFQFAAANQVIPTLPPWLTATGSEHATAIELSQDGTIKLTGSPLMDVPLGTAVVGGQLTTSQAGANRIQILGDHVATAGATLRTTNGGQILIGGDYQGLGPLPTSQSTFIDAASSITADGEIGGQIVIWSDGSTQFRGNISARGETAGGTVEVSGKEQLYFGGQVDLRSQGAPGTLLLDPQNIEIRAGSDPGGVNPNEPQVFYEDTLESSINGDVNLLFQADNNITIAPLSDGALTFEQGIGSISFLADADGDGQGSFTMASGDRLIAPGRDTFISAANITVGKIDTSTFSTIDNSEDAGDIYLTATHGNIVGDALTAIADGILNNSGNGGNVVLSAANSVTVGDITTAVDDDVLINNGNAGEITINAQTGSISTGALAANTGADNSNTGNGGFIALNAPQDSIISQEIITTAISPELDNPQGGNVQLNGGDTITVDFINATGQGQGGNIDVATQQFFQATSIIPNGDASLLTTGNGSIRLTYNSDPNLPFIVGDSNVHGTAGDITTGIDSLVAPQSFTESINRSTIELNNLFESSSDLELPGPMPFPPGSNTSDSDSPDILSPDSEKPEENLVLSMTETPLSVQNNSRRGINIDTIRENARTINSSQLIWSQIEKEFSDEFAEALNLPIPAPPSLTMTQQTLQQVSYAQNINPALMYIRIQDTHLELMLVSGEGSPVYRPVAVTAADVSALVETLHQTVTNPVLPPAQYLPAAQQLYDWLIRPMSENLNDSNIDHIGFVLDAGLRSLPMAALHDGDQFLIENYSIGLLPSAGLTPLEPSLESLSESGLSEDNATLAMGIANFETQTDLAAVPLELRLASQGKDDEQYLDHEATLNALRQRLEQGNFRHVHLATHAVFQPGSLEDSHVQLWDQSINLTQLKELPFDAIDFLILSACATALGNHDAEFGFAGLAVNVGVQTALASLWSINDEATLGLMSEFYRALEQQPLSRSAALRQAQLAMLQGNVGIVNGTVYGSGKRTIGYLPSLEASGNWDFSHPAYWSGFTMIGNPW
ncbi:MAG: CHAT domain-containing protein [Leptolyngbyaceae cyanobacterium MAG.088]|nr:CHAT domain-containing protein [Leptolyngbyaceae cyanobacterium MAG.088]